MTVPPFHPHETFIATIPCHYDSMVILLQESCLGSRLNTIAALVVRQMKGRVLQIYDRCCATSVDLLLRDSTVKIASGSVLSEVAQLLKCSGEWKKALLIQSLVQDGKSDKTSPLTAHISPSKLQTSPRRNYEVALLEARMLLLNGALKACTETLKSIRGSVEGRERNNLLQISMDRCSGSTLQLSAMKHVVDELLIFGEGKASEDLVMGFFRIFTKHGLTPCNVHIELVMHIYRTRQMWQDAIYLLSRSNVQCKPPTSNVLQSAVETVLAAGQWVTACRLANRFSASMDDVSLRRVACSAGWRNAAQFYLTAQLGRGMVSPKTCSDIHWLLFHAAPWQECLRFASQIQHPRFKNGLACASAVAQTGQWKRCTEMVTMSAKLPGCVQPVLSETVLGFLLLQFQRNKHTDGAMCFLSWCESSGLVSPRGLLVVGATKMLLGNEDDTTSVLKHATDFHGLLSFVALQGSVMESGSDITFSDYARAFRCSHWCSQSVVGARIGRAARRVSLDQSKESELFAAVAAHIDKVPFLKSFFLHP